MRAALLSSLIFLVACITSGDAVTVPPLAGTIWTLESIVGAGPNDSPQRPTLVFGVDRADGRSGCNTWSAAYMQSRATLRFHQIVTTRMACPYGMDAERIYISALERTRELQVIGSALILRDERGRELVRFFQASTALPPAPAH